MDVGVANLERRRLEEAAVEVRDVAQLPRRGCALLAGRVEDAEEKRKKHAGEELALADGVEAVGEEAALAVQPPLLLDEVEKEDAREDQQGFGIDGIAALVREGGAELRGGIAHSGAETVEELARERLAVEGAVEDAREVARAVERENVETVDRMGRRRVQIDVETAELSPRRKVVERQAL